MIVAIAVGFVFVGYTVYIGLRSIADAIRGVAYNGVRVSMGSVQVEQHVRYAPRAAAKGEG